MTTGTAACAGIKPGDHDTPLPYAGLQRSYRLGATRPVRERPGGAEVGLCTHDGGHDWPSGTSTAIWAFFERHTMP